MRPHLKHIRAYQVLTQTKNFGDATDCKRCGVCDLNYRANLRRLESVHYAQSATTQENGVNCGQIFNTWLNVSLTSLLNTIENIHLDRILCLFFCDTMLHNYSADCLSSLHSAVTNKGRRKSQPANFLTLIYNKSRGSKIAWGYRTQHFCG